MLKNIDKVWENLKKFDIPKITVQIKNFKNIEMKQGNFTDEGETINMGSPFQFMTSPAFLGFINNINRVMTFYPQAIKVFNIKAKPIDLKIIYDRQVFLIFLINSLEVYLSTIFKQILSILRIDDPQSDLIIRFVKKYGSLEKYSKYYEGGYKPEFISEFITKRIYFQQKDICKECFKFVDIDLPRLNANLWQRIFSKKDSYMQLRHEIIHGNRPSVEEINTFYSIESLELALFDVVNLVYLIEEQRFNKYPSIDEESSFIQSLRKKRLIGN